MNYGTEMFFCADEIARGAKKAGFAGEYYELTQADLEYLRGEQCDSLECLPFADESVQAGFERDTEAEVNRLMGGAA